METAGNNDTHAGQQYLKLLFHSELIVLHSSLVVPGLVMHSGGIEKPKCWDGPLMSMSARLPACVQSVEPDFDSGQFASW